MNRLVVTSAVLSLSLAGACGKSTKEQPSTAGESKVTENSAKTPAGNPEKPATAPVKAEEKKEEK